MFEQIAKKIRSWFASPQPPALAPAAAQARYAVSLALTFGSWVHRRTETFKFLDAYTVRRRMSVDFTLPQGRHLTPGQTVLVPLMILRKENLRNFDIEDSSGNSLTVLTSQQNGEVAYRGMSILLWGAWPADGPPPEETLGRFLEEPDPDAALAEYSEVLLEEPSPLRTALDNYPNEDEGRVIEALLQELVGGFMLLVPVEYQPGVRRHVKFSYDAAQTRVPWLSRRVRFMPSLSKALRGLSSLGLVSRLEEFEGVPIGWSQSYHAEVEPPPDIYCAEATLVPRGEELKPARDEHKRRPHLQIRGERRGDLAELTLVLYAEREVLIFPLLLAAVAITATLALIQDRATSLSPETLGPLLLLPVALVAFYVRSSENSYVRKTLLGVRLIAGIPAAAGVTVAAMLGVKYLGADNVSERSIDVASWAAHASVAASTLLALALVSPVLGAIRRWIVRKATYWTTHKAEEANWSERRKKWLNKAITGLMTLIGLLGYAAIAFGILCLFYAVLPLDTELPNAD